MDTSNIKCKNLETLCYQRAQEFFGVQLPDEVRDRLQFELEIIEKSGNSNYLLFLYNLVNTARKELGALIGPGRGPIGGSLVSYCLGITKVDPLKYDLLFERCINPDRFSRLEVWIDVDKDGRAAILDWLKEKNVKLTEKDTIIFEDESKKRKWQFLTKLVDKNVLSDMKTVLTNIKRTQGIDVDIDNIPIDDSLTFALFQKGDTDGVFCFEYMQDYFKYLSPTTFNDLVILNTMFCPVMIDYIPQMLQRRSGKEKIDYPIPVMEKYLQETYGILVYQEQLILLSRLIADFTRGESDILFQAINQKQKDELIVLKQKFIEGGERNEYKKETLEQIWTIWEEMGPHCSNKSHVICLTWMAYQMAYLKAHYPKEFMAMRKHYDCDIASIEDEILLMYGEHPCDDSKCEGLLSLRRDMINNKQLANQKELLPDIIAFNDALREALKEMYDRAHLIWDSIKEQKNFGDDMELTAKCYLSYEYPKLHPIQNEDRQDLWEAICDGGWNPLYEDGVLFPLTFPRDLNESFDSFIGMDCPPPNWNEGLDRELTKDLHIIRQFHYLFDHTKFAITDFIYVHKFETEINIEIRKRV